MASLDLTAQVTTILGFYRIQDQMHCCLSWDLLPRLARNDLLREAGPLSLPTGLFARGSSRHRPAGPQWCHTYGTVAYTWDHTIHPKHPREDNNKGPICHISNREHRRSQAQFGSSRRIPDDVSRCIVQYKTHHNSSDNIDYVGLSQTDIGLHLTFTSRHTLSGGSAFPAFHATSLLFAALFGNHHHGQ